MQTLCLILKNEPDIFCSGWWMYVDRLLSSVCIALHKAYQKDTACSYPVPLLKNEPKDIKSNFVFLILSSLAFLSQRWTVGLVFEKNRVHVWIAITKPASFTLDGFIYSLSPVSSVYFNYLYAPQSVWPQCHASLCMPVYEIKQFGAVFGED